MAQAKKRAGAQAATKANNPAAGQDSSNQQHGWLKSYQDGYRLMQMLEKAEQGGKRGEQNKMSEK